MSTDKNKDLCLALMNADSEQEVITILKSAGYWDDPAAWRNYGDSENPIGVTGNQQANPEAALAEKLTNSGDAVLLLACREAGIEPKSDDAPGTISDAVKQFFGGTSSTKLSERITIAATGLMAHEGYPCISIADTGEGQTPDMVPYTFLSLNKDNKVGIPFVQGRFNQGGAGVLRHGSGNSLQLIVTKRHPDFAEVSDRGTHWGFTVIRREPGPSHSYYRYLAPLREDGSDLGRILSFPSEKLAILPALGTPHPVAYGRETTHGSLIKLYEYRLSNKSNVVSSRPNLRSRLELLLAGAAIPMRIFECRTRASSTGKPFSGHSGSFDTDVHGIVSRLSKEGQDNLEIAPLPMKHVVKGDDVFVTVYALQPGKAKSYKQSEGILYLLNGQTHAITPKSIFGTKAVNLSYLKDDLLVVVDLSYLSTLNRENMIMSSRDRLSKDGHDDIEVPVSELLRENQILKNLQLERRKKDFETKLADEKPLENLLKEMLRRNPELARVLNLGSKLSNPFDVRPVDPKPKFEGKSAPTYFLFRGKPEGHKLCRDAQHGKKVRIDFETDARNEFFAEPDTKILVTGAKDGMPLPITDHSVNPDDGTIHIHLHLPDEVRPGDDVSLRIDLTSPLLLNSFTNLAGLHVVEPTKPGGGNGGKKQTPSQKKGAGPQAPQGIDIPMPIPRNRDGWSKTPVMNQHSALCIMPREEGGKTLYDYHINMDNVFLLNEIKLRPKDTTLLRNRYKLAMVLIGLSLVHDHEKPWTTPNVDVSDEEGEAPPPVELGQLVERTTRAFAPIVLPMIAGLANLTADQDILEDDEEPSVEEE